MMAVRALNRLSSLQKCCHGAVSIGSMNHMSTEALSVPSPTGVAANDITYSPKIEGLVGEISKLTLLEVSELTTALKKRLNLPDAPVMSFGAMPVGAPAANEEEEQVVAKVQTSFTVKLVKFDEKQKVPLIKELKNLMEGTNLVQAKKFVESAPAIVKADLSKDEAEQLKEAISKVGGECEIV